MTVHVQAVRFEADSKLIDYVEKKVTKLQSFHDRIVKVDVFLKLDNVVHTIKDKIAEIKIHIPRQQVFVKQSSKSFEQSFDEALDAAINQLKRKKEKVAAS
jgi:putative sigma-54 modulation protein